jgi:predicted porin
LGGGFGEVALGRDFTPAFYVALAGDPFGYDTVAQAGATHNQVGLSPVRWSNQVRYTSPSMGGFQLRAAWAPKESTGANDKDVMGVNAVYSAGPLYVGLGYDENGVQNNVTGANRANYWVLTAAYDFGMIRPGISYASGEAKNAGGTKLADLTNWTLFASMPLGSGSLRGLYAKRDNDIANTSVKKFGVGYHYDLSKRTKWYVDYGSASETGLKRHSAFDVGIQHNF